MCRLRAELNPEARRPLLHELANSDFDFKNFTRRAHGRTWPPLPRCHNTPSNK